MNESVPTLVKKTIGIRKETDTYSLPSMASFTQFYFIFPIIFNYRHCIFSFNWDDNEAQEAWLPQIRLYGICACKQV